MAMKYCMYVCIHRHTHPEACIPQLGRGRGEKGTCTRVCVCTQGERQSNFYSKSGLTVTVWLRYTVKLVHSYYNKFSNFSQEMNWSYPHRGLSVEPTHWDGACRSAAGAVRAYSLLAQGRQLRRHADPDGSTAERDQLKEWDIMVHKTQKLNSLLSHLLWLTLGNSSVLG